MKGRVTRSPDGGIEYNHPEDKEFITKSLEASKNLIGDGISVKDFLTAIQDKGTLDVTIDSINIFLNKPK